MRLSFLAIIFMGCGDDSGTNGCEGVNCAGHGRCIAEGASARCECDPGYVAVGLECQPGGGDSDSDSDSDTGTDSCADGDGDGFNPCGDSDCDDEEEDVHPGAIDQHGDTIDQDCDGWDGVDGDGDHHASLESFGDDCDDGNPSIYPGAPEDDEWTTEVASEDEGTDVSLAVDSEGVAHGVFEVVGAVQIRYVTNRGGGWGWSNLVDGVDPSLALGPGELAYVAYADTVFDHLGLTYQEDVGGGVVWTYDQSIDDNPTTGIGASIAFDGDVAHVLYEITEYGNVLHGHMQVPNGPFTSDAFWTAAPGQTGFEPSLCMMGGTAHGAVRDVGGSDLEYTNGVVAPEIVDNVGEGGRRPSIGCGGDGVVRIAYAHTEMSEVWYAVQEGVDSWSRETISPASPGGHVALALDGNDEPHVVFQGDDDVAWYAYRDGDVYVSQRIDSQVGTGETPAIAVRDDVVHVLYASPGPGRVTYASRGAPDGVDMDCDAVE